MTSKLIIFINPLPSYAKLCEALIAANIKIIALYSRSPTQNKYFQINPDYFIANEILSRDLTQDIERIKTLAKNDQLLTILPSDEIDLAYAEKISHAFCPELSNNPKDSNLRYKKYDMNEVLRQVGLNYIPQICYPLDETIAETIDLKFPVVVKPSSQSGASVGVKICENIDEVHAHFAQLQHSVDPFGRKLEADVVIQEKIEGDEYFADSVTWHGKHYITCIMKCLKTNLAGLPIYRYIQFIAPQHDRWKLSYDYIQHTLDALKVYNGFAHTEFIIDKNNQPYLMEINPRLSGLGGELNRLCKYVTGYDQTDVYIHLLTEQKPMINMHQQYQAQTKQGSLALLFSWQNMIFNGFNHEILKNLQSADYFFRAFKPEGSLLTPPQNLLDIVATVGLVDESHEKIMADINYLKQLEHQGKLFK